MDDIDKTLLACLRQVGAASLDQADSDFMESPAGQRVSHILTALPHEIEAPKTGIEVEVDADVMRYLVAYLYDRVHSGAPWLERRKLRRVIESPTPAAEPPLLAFTRIVRDILTAHPTKWQSPFRMVLHDHLDRLEQLAQITASQLGLEHR